MFLDNWAEALKKHHSFFSVALIPFPILSNLVRHSGSLFFTFFYSAGLPFVFSPRLRPQVEAHQKWAMAAFLSYGAVYILSFLYNGVTGMLGDFRLNHIDHEIRFLAFIPIFFLFRSVKLTQFALWSSILCGALLSGIFAIISYLWLDPGERVGGSYHSIAFGDLSLILAFLSIPALDYLRRTFPGYWFLPIAAFIGGGMACILSGTRGAWIAVPGLCLILFFYLSSVIKLFPRILLAGAIVVLLFTAYHIPATQITERIDAILEEVKAYQSGDRTYSSIGTRIEGWRVAFEIFSEHPIIGAGPGNYVPFMKKLISEGKQYTIAAAHSQPHGIYPSVMADAGIMGLAALMMVFLVPLGNAVVYIRYGSQVRHLGYALMILVVGFMHFGLTETIFSRNINVTFYIVLVASIMAVAAQGAEENRVSS